MKRRTLVSIGALALVVGGGLFLRSISVPRYEGEPTDHFDGERFRNHEGVDHGFGALVKWITNRDLGYWPDWIESTPGDPPGKPPLSESHLLELEYRELPTEQGSDGRTAYLLP